MTGTSGWDCLMLSVRATSDGGCEVQVGAGFVAALLLLACVLVGGCLEDDGLKAA